MNGVIFLLKKKRCGSLSQLLLFTLRSFFKKKTNIAGPEYTLCKDFWNFVSETMKCQVTDTQIKIIHYFNDKNVNNNELLVYLNWRIDISVLREHGWSPNFTLSMLRRNPKSRYYKKIKFTARKIP